jgi:hypothetical protein
MSDPIAFKWEWNINTVAVLLGFIGGFIAWGYTLAELRTGREQNATNIERLAAQSSGLDSRLALLERTLTRLDQGDYRMGQIEKAHEQLDVRVSRIVETYSNQFADFRTQLSAISTQIALTNQTLSRIENTPRPSP